jgi:hypothetical protein
MDDETILKAIASGAKGYADEAAPTSDPGKQITLYIMVRCGFHVA